MPLNYGDYLTTDCRFRYNRYVQLFNKIFNPSRLFTNGEQGVWYDPSDLTTLYQDAAGTTPVTSAGEPVGLMLDKSGNGNHATQATSAARPIYQTDGTYHWLEGDGVDDYLDTGLDHQEDWSAYLAVSGFAADIIFGGRSGTEYRWYLGGVFGVGGVFGNSMLADNSKQIVSLTSDNFQYEIKSNSTVVLSGSYTGSTQPPISSFLFARNNSGSPDVFTSARFYGGVVRKPISDDLNLIKWLANKAGVNLP